ncbi:MAG: hypothetical protein KA713_15940 [Chryseotalea sp. WA131a]|jgi:predicted transcriptional regulator|nr:MAG: hypothetical protein KA713_15940 [Chryseotalea sp. WA131a]
MDIELEKSAIINWVQKLKDIGLIQKINLLKEESEKSRISSNPNSQRKAGDGKYLIEYIAEDFNEPLDHFDENYRP